MRLWRPDLREVNKKSLPVRIHAILSNAGWLQRSCFYQGGSSSNSKIAQQCQIFNDNKRLKWVYTFYCNYSFLEDKFKDLSPVKLYDDEPVDSTVIDSNGVKIRVKTYLFSKQAGEKRSTRGLLHGLKSRNQMKTAKIGNTKLILVNLNDVVMLWVVRKT